VSQAGHSVLIVLYQQKLSESQSYRDLCKQLTADDHLIIYDNSPQRMLDVKLTNMTYFHDVTNGGLAHAYNFAVRLCRERGDRWLTIFDQDTTIPIEFYQSLLKMLKKYSSATVVVPRIKLDNGKQLSPFYIEDSLFIHYPSKIKKTPAAINSGMTINIKDFDTNDTLFNESYPLDFLDFFFFKQIQVSGKRIVVLPVTLVQTLSLSDFRTMSQQRFENFQFSEAKFVNEFYPRYKRQYHQRIYLRLLKQFLKRVQWSKLKVMLQVIGGTTSS
jgi:GT2 family glycosyltransferase